MEPTDQNMESVIRGWIGEAKLKDQRRVGELTAEVQRLQQVRGAAARTAMTQPATNLLDTRLGKPPVFRGEETKWQEWYFKFRAYIMCSGDRYPELVTAMEDPTQGPMDTTRWEAEQIEVSRHLYLILVMLTEESAVRIVQAHDSSGAQALRLMYRRYNPLMQERMLAKLNEVLQVDLGTDERTYMDDVVQWEQWIHEFETMSRETLPDIVKRAIITERSPSAIRTHLLVNAQTLTRYATVRAAIEAFLAVGRKWGPDHSRPAPMDNDAMTRKGKGKGGKSKGKGKGKRGQGEREQQGQGHRERESSANRRLLRTLWQMECFDKRTVGRDTESQ